MEDIVDSLNRALMRQGWVFTDKIRIGNPFQWVDGDTTPWMYSARGVHAVLRYLAMYYEQYPTPNEIMIDDYDQMHRHIEGRIRSYYEHHVPFIDSKASGFETNIVCTAMVRLQDYCCLRTFCADLKDSINHLDIGPGLGSHATYSLQGFNSSFYALEASPYTYSVQRQFFRFLSGGEASYLDLVDCERLEVDEATMAAELNEATKYRIKHVPSWYFQLIKDQTIDLVTASWVLNEVSDSGILWIMANSMRSLRKGEYFYIRDSFKLKPMRHSVDYDKLLLENGFVEVGRLNVDSLVKTRFEEVPAI